MGLQKCHLQVKLQDSNLILHLFYVVCICMSIYEILHFFLFLFLVHHEDHVHSSELTEKHFWRPYKSKEEPNIPNPEPKRNNKRKPTSTGRKGMLRNDNRNNRNELTTASYEVKTRL